MTVAVNGSTWPHAPDYAAWSKYGGPITKPFQTQTGPTFVYGKPASLSAADIDRIARRVVEMLDERFSVTPLRPDDV